MKLPFINESIFEPYKSPIQRRKSSYIWYRYVPNIRVLALDVLNDKFLAFSTLNTKHTCIKCAKYQKM